MPAIIVENSLVYTIRKDVNLSQKTAYVVDHLQNSVFNLCSVYLYSLLRGYFRYLRLIRRKCSVYSLIFCSLIDGFCW